MRNHVAVGEGERWEGWNARLRLRIREAGYGPGIGAAGVSSLSLFPGSVAKARVQIFPLQAWPLVRGECSPTVECSLAAVLYDRAGARK